MFEDVIPVGNEYYYKDSGKENQIICVFSGKKGYRKFKDCRKISRKTEDILFALDEDETAIIGCFLKKKTIYVWSPVFIRKEFIYNKTIRFAYMCVLKKGVYVYPLKDIRELLLQEGERITCNAEWKYEQQKAREYIDELISAYKKDPSGLLNFLETSTIQRKD